MTDQQKTPFTIAELGAKFGPQLAQAYAEIITLEKQLQAHVLTIQQFTENEKMLLDKIDWLENKLDKLVEDRKEPPG